jgi:hypothetical protein
VYLRHQQAFKEKVLEALMKITTMMMKMKMMASWQTMARDHCLQKMDKKI